MKKNIRSRQAVSEVIGVVLLLGITITLFAVLNYSVFHISFNPSTTSANLIGTIDSTKKMIYIEHNGGESLDGATEIRITIGSTQYKSTLMEIINNTDSVNWTLIVPLPSQDSNPERWDFGEIVRFSASESITNKFIAAEVIDLNQNSVILSVNLQQESI